ncbi:MAG: hypothetical protein LBJ13_02650 [Puniceicoccales bacterium]|nr:hypothetical protein [Puniceicoccales bacterium]
MHDFRATKYVFLLISMVFVEQISAETLKGYALRKDIPPLFLNKMIKAIFSGTGSFEDVDTELEGDKRYGGAAKKPIRRKLYCAVRSIKELQNQDNWYARRLVDEDEALRDLFLFTHVISGHFLNIDKARLIVGESRYEVPTDGSWYMHNKSWTVDGLTSCLSALSTCAQAIGREAEDILNLDVDDDCNNIYVPIAGGLLWENYCLVLMTVRIFFLVKRNESIIKRLFGLQ